VCAAVLAKTVSNHNVYSSMEDEQSRSGRTRGPTPDSGNDFSTIKGWTALSYLRPMIRFNPVFTTTASTHGGSGISVVFILCVVVVVVQFILYSPSTHITNSPQRALQYVHIDIPDLWPLTSHRIRKNSPEIEEKNLSGWKKRKTFRREQRRIPLQDGQKQLLLLLLSRSLQILDHR